MADDKHEANREKCRTAIQRLEALGYQAATRWLPVVSKIQTRRGELSALEWCALEAARISKGRFHSAEVVEDRGAVAVFVRDLTPRVERATI